MGTNRTPKQYEFDLSGGHLALDFANSVSRRDSPERRVDHLGSFQDLISFAGQSKLITPQQAETLRRKSQANPRVAAQLLRKTIALREALFRTFMSLAKGETPSPEDIDLIERSATDALGHRRMVGVNGGYEWQWEDDSELERIVWPIAESAAALLTSRDLPKLRECGAPDCQWLFLDTSRNHSRRWCDMSSCGNRAKARRHYRRHQVGT